MMISRRETIAAFAAFAEFLRSGSADAHPQPPAGAPQTPPRPPVFVQSLPNLTMEDWEVTVSVVDYAPGRVGGPHKHAGFVLAYVLEGSVVAKVSGQGDGKVDT